MKNNEAMNLTQLATADRLSLELADTRGELKFTKLPPAKPRRSQLVYTAARVGGSRRGSSQKVG
jgi:hypothetical protein